MTKKQLFRTLIILVIGLATASLIAFYQVNSEKKHQGVVASNFGGSFTLTDHHGKIVTNQDFTGKYRLIYFGFTYCPAICPTELQRIATVLKELGPQGDIIQPIFITVDPERDTVQVMKNYVELFHPRLIGLTGTPEQIETVKKGYKIYAAKVQDDTMHDYTMDHSSFIYLMDPDDNLIKVFKVDDSIEYITAEVQKSL